MGKEPAARGLETRVFAIGSGVRKLLPQLGLSEDEVKSALEKADNFERCGVNRWCVESCQLGTKALIAECHVDHNGVWHVVYVFER